METEEFLHQGSGEDQVARVSTSTEMAVEPTGRAVLSIAITS